MIISHNQELMIHAIVFGSNNPMSKIGSCYVVTNENDNNNLFLQDKFIKKNTI